MVLSWEPDANKRSDAGLVAMASTEFSWARELRSVRLTSDGGGGEDLHNLVISVVRISNQSIVVHLANH